MVDTINPNTNQPDVPVGAQTPVQPAVPENRFYGGFDKPDETKINLADSQPTPMAAPNPSLMSEPTPPPAFTSAPQPVVESRPQPVADVVPPVVAPVAPSEVQHTSYVNTANAINWRGIIVIVLIGLVVTGLAGTGLYFGLKMANKKKVDEQQSRYDSLQNNLTTLKATPSPLELPASATTTTPTPTVETPVVTPVVTPTPIETPQTTTPAATDDGSKQAAG